MCRERRGPTYQLQLLSNRYRSVTKQMQFCHPFEGRLLRRTVKKLVAFKTYINSYKALINFFLDDPRIFNALLSFI